MAAKQQYITINSRVLTNLENLVSLGSADLACQGTVALLSHFNATEQKYYSRAQLSSIFKSHTYEVTNSRGEEVTKHLSGSPATITRWLKALKDTHCCTEPAEMTINGKRSDVFNLETVSPLPRYLLARSKEISTNRSSNKGGRPKPIVNSTIHSWASNHNNIIPILTDAPLAKARTEKITTILFSASPSEGQAKSMVKNGGPLERVSRTWKSRSVGEVKIHQTRTTRKGIRLSSPEDKGVLHAILGLTHTAYQATVLDRKMIDEHGVVELQHDSQTIYIMDIYKLCKDVGRNPQVPSDREIVRGAVERLMFNQWEIEGIAPTPEFKGKFMAGMDRTFYQYLEPIGTISQVFSEELKDNTFITFNEDRYIVFKLGAWFQHQISSGETYLVHDELKSDRSEIAQQLYSFARGYCGSGSKGSKKHTFTLYAAWTSAFQQMREDNFLTGLLKFAKRQNEKTIYGDLLGNYYPSERCDPFELTDHSVPSRKTIDFEKKSSGTFWYCGYFFKLEIDEAKSKLLHRKNRTLAKFESYKVPRPVLTIWRDEEDPLVGNNSDGNHRTRRIKAELDRAQSQALLKSQVEKQSGHVDHNDLDLQGECSDVDELLDF